MSVANSQDDERKTAETTGAPRSLNVEGLLFALLLVVLAWAPFPYGSNRLWAELVLGAGLGILAMSWALAAVLGRAAITSVTNKLLLPALCYGAALSWAAVQTIDLAAVDRALGTALASSLAHPVWTLAEDALGSSMGAFISVDPALTHRAIARALLSLAAFLLAFEIGRDARRARTLFQAIVVVATVYAALGLAAGFAGFDGQSWLMAGQPASEGRVAAPFINPNHFAAYVGLAALCSLGLLIQGLRRGVVWDRESRVLVRTLLHALTGPLAAWLIAFVVLSAALLLSQSRGGVFAFLASATALGVALSGDSRRSDSSGANGRMIIFGLLALLLAIAIWLGGAPLFDRLAGDRDVVSSRKEFSASTIDAIKSAPLLGLGFGAFERYFPFFGDGKFDGNIDKAHNDYLETVADLGVPAGAAFVAAPLILGLYCAAGALRRKRGRLFPAVGVAATVLVGAHAFVEFGLQIPAIAVTFAAILGVGAAQSWSPAKREME